MMRRFWRWLTRRYPLPVSPDPMTGIGCTLPARQGDADDEYHQIDNERTTK